MAEISSGRIIEVYALRSLEVDSFNHEDWENIFMTELDLVAIAWKFLMRIKMSKK